MGGNGNCVGFVLENNPIEMLRLCEPTLKENEPDPHPAQAEGSNSGSP
jgi:hypothetical protein